MLALTVKCCQLTPRLATLPQERFISLLPIPIPCKALELIVACGLPTNSTRPRGEYSLVRQQRAVIAQAVAVAVVCVAVGIGIQCRL